MFIVQNRFFFYFIWLNVRSNAVPILFVLHARHEGGLNVETSSEVSLNNARSFANISFFILNIGLPIILLIILFDKTSQEYIRAVQDESMTVELTRESNLEENEFKLLILKGSLQIYFSNPRPGLDRDITYYFSFVNKRFRLTKETVKMQFMASGKRESSQKDFSRLGPLFIDNFYFSELITR